MSEQAAERAFFGLAAWHGDVSAMTATHRHDDLEFTSADVDLDYLIDGREQRIGAGSLAVFWAARPHRLARALTPGVQAWLTVPLRDALAWTLPQPFLRRVLAGDVLTIDRPRAGSANAATDLLSRAGQWREELGGDALAQRIARIEVEAFALRVARAASPAVARATTGTASRASAMAAYISEHADQALSVAEVAASVHLHPQHAMTVFRRRLGVTMGDYVAQCRVARAQHLLLTTDEPVAAIGHAAGFGSQSQFYARFTTWCGQSPAAYRRRLREG